MNKKRWLIIAVIAIVAAAVGALCVRYLYQQEVYAGVSFEGIPVGGKSGGELVALISEWQQEHIGQNAEFYYGDQLYSVEAADIDFALDSEATADEIRGFGRSGSWVERSWNIGLAAVKGYNVKGRMIYNEAKLEALVDRWRRSIDREPKNATISILTGEVIAEEIGQRLEVDIVKKQVLAALEYPVERQPLPVMLLYPEVSRAGMQADGLDTILASFVTYFTAGDVERSANVRLAASKLNGYILNPGQVFSFNDVVGPREKKFGFKDAMEIINGEYVPGVGGGVCQVSSTLYNAALLGNMTIVERTNHSKPLGYVALGRDATVYYGVLDFKFKNSREFPVMLVAETKGTMLAVGIVGRKSMQQKVEIVTANRRVIQPEVKKIPDPTLPKGKTKIEKPGAPGFEVTTIRSVLSGGAEIKREILAIDTYSPEDQIVKIGTAIVPVHPNVPDLPKQVEEN